MKKYLFQVIAGLLFIRDMETGRQFTAKKEDVLVLKRNYGAPEYVVTGVPEFSEKALRINENNSELTQIFNENGDAFTISDFESFYANFNGGGSAPKFVTGLISFNLDAPSLIIEQNKENFDLGIEFDTEGTFYKLNCIGNLQTDKYRLFMPSTLINTENNLFNYIDFVYEAFAPDSLLIRVFNNAATPIQSPNLNIPFKIEFY